MPIEVNKIKENQTIYDLCIEKYGSLDFISNLVFDNDISFDSLLDFGTELKTDAGIGIIEVKSKLKEVGGNIISYISPYIPSNSRIWDTDNIRVVNDAGDYRVYE